MLIDRSKPIYIQVIEIIKSMIVRGELKPGDKVPTVRELARELKINPNTVARAYYVLEDEGLLNARVGDGTFVTRDIELINKVRKELMENSLREFINKIKELGITKEELQNILEDIWKQ